MAGVILFCSAAALARTVFTSQKAAISTSSRFLKSCVKHPIPRLPVPMTHCKGCFNPETWNFSYGKCFTDETVSEILNALRFDHIEGLSLLGGEPFEPENQEELLRLTSLVRKRYPQKTIWCYSGFTFENQLFPGKVGNPET